MKDKTTSFHLEVRETGWEIQVLKLVMFPSADLFSELFLEFKNDFVQLIIFLQMGIFFIWVWTYNL